MVLHCCKRLNAPARCWVAARRGTAPGGQAGGGGQKGAPRGAATLHCGAVVCRLPQARRGLPHSTASALAAKTSYSHAADCGGRSSQRWPARPCRAPDRGCRRCARPGGLGEARGRAAAPPLLPPSPPQAHPPALPALQCLRVAGPRPPRPPMCARPARWACRRRSQAGDAMRRRRGGWLGVAASSGASSCPEAKNSAVLCRTCGGAPALPPTPTAVLRGGRAPPPARGAPPAARPPCCAWWCRCRAAA